MLTNVIRWGCLCVWKAVPGASHIFFPFLLLFFSLSHFTASVLAFFSIDFRSYGETQTHEWHSVHTPLRWIDPGRWLGNILDAFALEKAEKSQTCDR